jgi:hypothetical protein
MKQFSPEDLAKLLEDLSYSFSQSAADHFRKLTQQGKGVRARKLLLDEGFNEDESKAIYTHYRKLLKGYSIVWREITAQEAIEMCGSDKTVNLLFRYRSAVFTYPLSLHTTNWNDTRAYEVYYDGELIDISDIDQIWIGDKQ